MLIITLVSRKLITQINEHQGRKIFQELQWLGRILFSFYLLGNVFKITPGGNIFFRKLYENTKP